MHLAARSSASSGWVPATILAIATAVVVVGYGVSIGQVAIFGVYVAFGIALPGLLLVRFLRGRAGYIAEDVALGLCAGYAIEIATYLVARALGRSAAVPRLADRHPRRVHGRARPPIALARERHPRTGRLVVVAGGDPRDPARLYRRDLLRAAPPDRHGHAVRGHGLSPRADRRAAAPRPAGHPVRHRRPARLPLVLLCRGRGDELGDRHRAHRPALPPVRACRCSRRSWS